jgi:uncharacterized protein (TIGR03435 family)
MIAKIAIGCAFALSALPAFGQAPAFDVATVKPSDPNRPMAINRSGYHLATVSTSLEFLISWAYDIHRDRIYGKPKWLDDVRYDVVANAPEGYKAAPQPGQPGPLQQMTQALLAERFRLAVHSEKRELPMYALVVAKDGPKVKVEPFAGDMGQNPFAMPGMGRLIGTRVRAVMLCKVLSDQLGRSVEDRTGLDGVFDFKLEWEPDGMHKDPNAPVRASLFTALQEQLGLKLEARKGPVEVLVIDRVESTPTEN